MRFGSPPTASQMQIELDVGGGHDVILESLLWFVA